MGLNEKFFKSASDTPFINTDNFNTVIYTGNGGTQSITSLDFEPDLVWIKDRSGTNFHNINDSVRGTLKNLQSNTTTAEQNAPNGGVSSFDSNGFTLGTGGSIYSDVSASSTNYVAWCWKAGGADVLNQEGTIDSQVSANVDAGFSIVSWTGNGNDATVGTGLSQQAELVITKGRANLATYNSWITYHKDLSTNYHLYLNTTDSEQNGIGDYFRDSAFTSEVFGLGNDIYGPNVNNTTMIAYCFHSVDDYQKVGSYTGNGGTLNVTTGFEPRFVMLKPSSLADNWMIYDNQRGKDIVLFPNLSNADTTYTGRFSFLSDGFQLSTSNSGWNGSGSTYIYLAIA